MRVKVYMTMALTVVMFRCKVVSPSCWSPGTSFSSCLGRCGACTLRLAWPSTMLTSMSAIAGVGVVVSALILRALSTLPPWEAAAEVEYCGKVKKPAKGD